MPTAREVIANRPLSSTELRPILHAVLDKLIENEGMLSPHLAYGRIAFTLTLALHVDNPMAVTTPISLSSAPPAVNATPEELSAKGALQSPPIISPTAEAAESVTEAEYSIDSPNAERLRHGLPVSLDVKQMDGTITQEKVTYPPDPSLGPGEVKISQRKRK
jgi:hypothetical protein